MSVRIWVNGMIPDSENPELIKLAFQDPVFSFGRLRVYHPVIQNWQLVVVLPIDEGEAAFALLEFSALEKAGIGSKFRSFLSGSQIECL